MKKLRSVLAVWIRFLACLSAVGTGGVLASFTSSDDEKSIILAILRQIVRAQQAASTLPTTTTATTTTTTSKLDTAAPVCDRPFVSLCFAVSCRTTNHPRKGIDAPVSRFVVDIVML